jgi:Tfp pilus assembly protein PilF
MVPVELAKRATSRHPSSCTVYTLGMAHLGAGQLDEAAGCFHESLKRDPTWDARYLNWLGLALVEHEHGDKEATQQWLSKAVNLMEHDPGHIPHDRIEGRLLWREVERLLKESEQKKDTAASQEKE